MESYEITFRCRVKFFIKVKKTKVLEHSITEVYSEPCQTSKMERFQKKVSGF